MPSTATVMTAFSDTLRVSSLDDIAEAFDAKGAVIIQSNLSDVDLDTMLAFFANGAVEKKAHGDNPGRWRYRPRSDLAYAALLGSSQLQDALDILTDFSLRGCQEPGLHADAWQYGNRGGDETEPSTDNFQELHSDWPSYANTSWKFGYGLVVSLALHDVPLELAPIRLVPWNKLKHSQQYPKLETDKFLQGYEVTLKRGELLIRDCRAAHGGCPNLDVQKARMLPAVQVLSPQRLRYLGHL